MSLSPTSVSATPVLPPASYPVASASSSSKSSLAPHSNGAGNGPARAPAQRASSVVPLYPSESSSLERPVSLAQSDAPVESGPLAKKSFSWIASGNLLAQMIAKETQTIDAVIDQSLSHCVLGKTTAKQFATTCERHRENYTDFAKAIGEVGAGIRTTVRPVQTFAGAMYKKSHEALTSLSARVTQMTTLSALMEKMEPISKILNQLGDLKEPLKAEVAAPMQAAIDGMKKEAAVFPQFQAILFGMEACVANAQKADGKDFAASNEELREVLNLDDFTREQHQLEAVGQKLDKVTREKNDLEAAVRSLARPLARVNAVFEEEIIATTPGLQSISRSAGLEKQLAESTERYGKLSAEFDKNAARLAEVEDAHEQAHAVLSKVVRKDEQEAPAAAPAANGLMFDDFLMAPAAAANGLMSNDFQMAPAAVDAIPVPVVAASGKEVTSGAPKDPNEFKSSK